MYNDYRELVQFGPARAKKKLATIEELTPLHAKYWDEQKIDGERYKLHSHVPVIQNGITLYQHAITSRRVSEVTNRYVEKTDRVPHLTGGKNPFDVPTFVLPPQSLLDNELVASGDALYRDLPGKFWDKLMEPQHPHMVWLKKTYGGQIPIYPHVADTVSIMGSLGPEAVSKQATRGIVWAYCFDLMQFMGKSLLKQPQDARRRLLTAILEKVDPRSGLVLMPAWHRLTVDEITELFYLVTDPFKEADGMGGEGLILKDPLQPYDAARNWYKVKRDYPVDCVFTGGYKVGEMGKTGQMLGLASSLEIGVYKHGTLFPVGWISAIMDGHHNLVTPEQVEFVYKGNVVECRHNGTQKDPTSPLGISLRHPRFRRHRNDKTPTDCTFEALMAEAGKSRD